MRKSKKMIPCLLFYALNAVMYCSGCKTPEVVLESDSFVHPSDKENLGPGFSDKTKADHGQDSAVRMGVNDSSSRTGVLKHYSDLFIASKTPSRLNLRDEPSTNGRIIGKIPKNGGGEILKNLGEWYYVRSGGIEGYVASKYCVSGKEARTLAPSVAVRMVRATIGSLNVRYGPGLEFEILTQIGPDDLFPIIKDLGEWYQIRFSRFEGYITKTYAEPEWYLAEAVPSGISAKRQKLLRYAGQFVGIPYKLGGTSLSGSGIDCSNFVHECLKNALGIGLDRTAGQLASRGFTVSFSEAKPGDLMFYADQEGKINHVAIYMGDGRIIHSALSFGQVSISSYNYNSEPVLIKNVIGE